MKNREAIEHPRALGTLIGITAFVTGVVLVSWTRNGVIGLILIPAGIMAVTMLITQAVVSSRPVDREAEIARMMEEQINEHR